MAAPTSAVQKLQKILANGEPSTDGLKHASSLISRWQFLARNGGSHNCSNSFGYETH